MANENKRLQAKVELLENQVEETSKRLIDVERCVIENQQYSRRNNVEIQGIPDSVEENDLEEKIIEVLSSIDVPVSPEEIEACHRLYSKSSPKPVIIKFMNRKKCDEIMENKRKLSSCDKTALGFNENIKLFAGDNLSPANKRLFWKCRQLKRAKLITIARTSNGVVRIKVKDGDKYKKITHDSDVEKIFPDFDFVKGALRPSTE